MAPKAPVIRVERQRPRQPHWLFIVVGTLGGLLIGALLPVQPHAASVYLGALFGALAGELCWRLSRRKHR